MRWAFAMAVALAGCYRPGEDPACTVQCVRDCPGALRCVRGLCEDPQHSCSADAADDADNASDAARSEDCTGAAIQTTVNATGSSFVVDDQGTSAVKQRATGGVSWNTTPPFDDSNDALLFAGLYVRPRLWRSGTSMFVQDASSGAVVVAQLTNGTWTALGSSITGPAPMASDTTSTPTTTTPPRMVITRPSPAPLIIELEQGASQLQWSAKLSYAPSYPGITFQGDAHLSADGLRLVFLGSDALNHEHVYVVDRASLGTTFATGVPRALPGPSGDPSIALHSPYLAPGCRLYVTTGTQLMRFDYQ